MLLKLIEYHWAEHIDDALLLLGRLDTRTVPLAGGTYLLGLQDDNIEAVVDLRDLGLAYISEDGRNIHIGAMTTLQELVDEPLLKDLAMGILSRTAHASSSSRLIRNSATIGGTLGAGPASQADLLTALAVMDAEAVVRSGSKTQIDLGGGSFERPGLALSGVVYKGKHERRIPCSSYSFERRANELIVEVVVPRPGPLCGASFLRIAHTPTDVALLNAAALVEVENGLYKRIRVALGGASMETTRLHALETQLQGQKVMQPLDSRVLLDLLQVGMSTFRPPADIRVSSSYRRVSGMSLVYRVLEEAINGSYWRSMLASEKGV